MDIDSSRHFELQRRSSIPALVPDLSVCLKTESCLVPVQSMLYTMEHGLTNGTTLYRSQLYSTKGS